MRWVVFTAALAGCVDSGDNSPIQSAEECRALGGTVHQRNGGEFCDVPGTGQRPVVAVAGDAGGQG